MPDGHLYDTDWYAWTQAQATALRRMAEARANTELDLDHLAEEVELLGGSEICALESALARIVEHLLKLEHSPAADSRHSWLLSVVEQRSRAQRILRRSGTIRRSLPDLLPDAWEDGRKLAAKALELFDGIDPATLPADCPYSAEQILDDGFHPANRHGLS
ncbi:DUF29 domain-containing protein [Azospirillum sp. SYSU D00513]|uniref:DUF29 domain-containing protein n=1 Tax=Azospirillum sp. SYSU D00513 TaxID=2812561 RepID=UPI001A978992|nr:DUF29 domain-containing protein [Azospirillum sp. SYSU D00513]